MRPAPFLFCFWLAACASPARVPASVMPDGSLASSAAYVLPPFETSGFLQRPDVREYFEGTIRPAYEKMAKATRVTELVYFSDGLRIKGYALEPRGPAKSPRPILVFNHGGNRDYGKLTIHDLLWLSDFAARGYLVVASQYRGVDGGEGADEFGGRDVHDVVNVVRLAKAWPGADAARVYLLGHSRGGMMTYLTLKDSRDFRAAAILAGECDLERGLADWPDFEKEVYAEIIPDYAANKAAALRDRSACDWPERIHAPVFILQGEADKNVSPVQAKMMAEKLRAVHTQVKMELVPGADHQLFFRPPARAAKVKAEIDAWFREHP